MIRVQDRVPDPAVRERVSSSLAELQLPLRCLSEEALSVDLLQD
jgi:hypothetical protein